jgi:hypothetical protein
MTQLIRKLYRGYATAHGDEASSLNARVFPTKLAICGAILGTALAFIDPDIIHLREDRAKILGIVASECPECDELMKILQTPSGPRR